MGRTGRIAGALVFGVLAGCTDAAAEPLNQFAVHVSIMDGVGVDADHCVRRRRKPGDLQAAGVTLAWRLGGQEPPPVLSSCLSSRSSRIQSVRRASIPQRSPQHRDRRKRAAQSHICSSIASIISGSCSSSRCRSCSARHGARNGSSPVTDGSHAASGIMKAGWGTQQARLASTHSLTFEPSQAALIRARLRQRR